MKYPTVSALCEGVAGAIRAKEGSTEKINPQDFVQRIENLQVGGGVSESSIEYLDVSGLDNEYYFLGLVLSAIYVKAKISNGELEGSEVIGMNMAHFSQMSTNFRDVKSICIDLTSIISQKTGDEVQSMTVEDMLVSGGSVTKEQLDSIPRLTKEQFYTLD